MVPATAATTTTKLAALQTERDRIRRNMRRRHEQNKADQQRLFRIDDQILVERMRSLIGVRHAVKRRYRDARNYPELNDALGTITEVRHTRCSVVFTLPNGTEETFDFPLDRLTPVDSDQGFFIGQGGLPMTTDELLSRLAKLGWETDLNARSLGRIAGLPLRGDSYELAAITCELAIDNQPITVRGLFYRVVSTGFFPGTDHKYYNKFQGLLVSLRRHGLIPYPWIVDNIRSTLRPSSWSGLDDFADTVKDAAEPGRPAASSEARDSHSRWSTPTHASARAGDSSEPQRRSSIQEPVTGRVVPSPLEPGASLASKVVFTGQRPKKARWWLNSCPWLLAGCRCVRLIATRKLAFQIAWTVCSCSGWPGVESKPTCRNPIPSFRNAVKIITYNLRSGGNGCVHWNEVLEEFAPDILLVQESSPPLEHLPPLLHGDRFQRAVWSPAHTASGPGGWGSGVYVKSHSPVALHLPEFHGWVTGAEIPDFITPEGQAGPLRAFSLHAPTGMGAYAAVVNRILDMLLEYRKGC